MIKSIWAGVAGVALLGAAGATAVVVASTGGEEEIPPAVEETATSAASPTTEPSVTPTPGAPATVAPTATDSPQPSQLPVPDDWPTYSDPEGRFTVRYPPTWFQHGAQFRDFDPETWDRYSLKPDSVEVEVNTYPAIGSSGCGGSQSVDSQTGIGSPQPGATPATLGGVAGWQLTRLPGDPALNELTRIDGISVIYKGTCFIVAGYYTQGVPDVEPFRQIASSFTFTH